VTWRSCLCTFCVLHLCARDLGMMQRRMSRHDGWWGRIDILLSQPPGLASFTGTRVAAILLACPSKMGDIRYRRSEAGSPSSFRERSPWAVPSQIISTASGPTQSARSLSIFATKAFVSSKGVHGTSLPNTSLSFPVNFSNAETWFGTGSPAKSYHIWVLSAVLICSSVISQASLVVLNF